MSEHSNRMAPRTFASGRALFYETDLFLKTDGSEGYLDIEAALTLSLLLDRVDHVQSVRTLFTWLYGKPPHAPVVMHIKVSDNITAIQSALGDELGDPVNGAVRAHKSASGIVGYFAVTYL